MNINPKNKFWWFGILLIAIVIASGFTDDPFALVESIVRGLDK